MWISVLKNCTSSFSLCLPPKQSTSPRPDPPGLSLRTLWREHPPGSAHAAGPAAQLQLPPSLSAGVTVCAPTQLTWPLHAPYTWGQTACSAHHWPLHGTPTSRHWMNVGIKISLWDQTDSLGLDTPTLYVLRHVMIKLKTGFLKKKNWFSGFRF